MDQLPRLAVVAAKCHALGSVVHGELRLGLVAIDGAPTARAPTLVHHATTPRVPSVASDLSSGVAAGVRLGTILNFLHAEPDCGCRTSL